MNTNTAAATLPQNAPLMAPLLGGRIDAIDILRGLIILIMMLDHVRERFFMHTPVGDPIFDHIAPEFFFTRFITHFCAPIFIFLAGMSAWLYAHPANGTYRSPSGFLFKRGLVLMMFDIVLYTLLWFDLGYNTIWLQVLWAIGLSMLGLSVACKMNIWLIGALGVIITFGHDLLNAYRFTPENPGFILWAILNQNAVIGQIAGMTIKVSYPSLAWFGVILLGYCAGALFAKTMSPLVRIKSFMMIGLACILTLLVLRGFNLYGEALPWSVQATGIETLMSFLNVTKYPPSLNYLLVTLGVGCMLLALFEAVQQHAVKPLSVLKTFGSAPMFVYFAHLYLILAAYWILFTIIGPTHDERFGLPTVETIWIGTVMLTAILYIPTKKFAAYKHKHKNKKPWLSYL
ncbi:DUF1624 domain-containing protein [Shewanella sp.]|uniref:DUF1624 domain-containing protein n=1 Tax=Shewanella sp. TaxID=50422 RepID=UPI00404793E7